MRQSDRETRVFDPALGFAPLIDVIEVTDSTLARRGDRWWMYLAGEAAGHEGIRLFSASLPAGAPLGAHGWRLTPDPGDPTRIALLAESRASAAWDLRGGRHCPCYVKGFDPGCGAWLERVYYAGARETPWGPYRIGFLEWDGECWREQAEPVFAAVEDWERGSVFEPNVLYAEGRWKMWYVAGSNADDYLVHGFSESLDGRGGWSAHRRFSTPEEKLRLLGPARARRLRGRVLAGVGWEVRGAACDGSLVVPLRHALVRSSPVERARADPDRRRARLARGPLEALVAL